ncbi:MAG: lysophospholipid acyltransferase family protein [Steroidobacteraceae bacterium]
MLSAIDRAWRLLATGFSFLTFGVGGILLWAIGLPLLFVLFPQPARRQKAARRLIHRLFWLFLRMMRLLGVLRFEVVGAGRLKRPGLVIAANHPTLLDVVFLLSMVPDATCIVRAGLADNPFTRAAVRSAGYVCNDWGVELVDACVQALGGGSSLIVFPEGTRSNASRPQKWHRGAANIALRTGISLTPVTIACEPPSLRKGEPWWHIPRRRMHYSIRVLDDVPVGRDSSRWESDVQAARGLTCELQELLTERVERNAGA